jgi:hypothetical protein
MGGDQDRGVELPSWVPEGVDVTTPNVARIYDCLLGGFYNFAVDREHAEQMEKAYPRARQDVYANRAFLGRVVRWLIDAGIRQFLDIGSGIPTIGNVHEVAQQAAPEARVMYVDIDPVAVAHTRVILGSNPRAGVLQADLRSPMTILDHPDVTDLLDFSEPVAVTLVAALPFIPDTDDPYAIVGQLRDAVVAGSYIALSHTTQVAELATAQEAVRQLLKQTPTPFYFRSQEQIARLLIGLDIVEPGIVPVNDWHPDHNEGASEPSPTILAAVGRKS